MDPLFIATRQSVAGLEGTLGCWICGRDPNIVMDIGPAASIADLIQKLLDLKMERVDFVLLSHIHLDHAGGLAEFLERFPAARVICHAMGKRHLVEPGRLWEASLQTLGDLARSYGPPRAVAEERIITHTEAAVPGLQVIATPGHAPHHLSFAYQGNLFVGEAAGVYYRMKDADYLRSATPTPFFLQEFVKSIDRLLELEDQPICFAHFARALSSREMLGRAKEQIFRWKAILEEEISKGSGDLVARCSEEILNRDPELKQYGSMNEVDRGRERFFLKNSVTGFLGYLERAGKK